MTHATPDDLDARAAFCDDEADAYSKNGMTFEAHAYSDEARTLRALAAEARQYEVRHVNNVIQFPAPQNRRISLNTDGMRAVKALDMVLGESDAEYALRVVTAYVRGCGE